MKRSTKYVVPTLLTMTVLTTLFLLISGGVGANSLPQGRSPIPGHLIPSLTGKTPTGAPDGQQQLHLTISLNLADPAGLQALIQAQNDKHAAVYHHYLTPQQFTTRYAPSQASVNAVVSFLRSQGLTVKSVAANHLSIQVDGTVAAVEQAFQAHIANYSLNGHTVFAPSNEPSVPSSLAGMILNIGGLDNTSTPHRLGALAPNRSQTQNPQTPALGPGGGYTPSELRTAYDMNPLLSTADGTGQTVALVELDGYIPGDVNRYLSFYGLGSPKYSNVLLDGATGAPTANGGAFEVELDMEVVSAIAPGAALKIYIAPNGLANFQGFLDNFNQIVMDDTAKVVSNSWGLCEASTGTSVMQAFDNVFAQGAAQGQAFFTASGDAGAYDCGTSNLAVDFPASDPNVVGVGGTLLSTGSGGSYSSETAWSCPSPGPNSVCTRSSSGDGSGGGLSSYFAQPSYQTGPGVTNTYSNGKREVPDVSADASESTPYSEYCTDASGCLGIGWVAAFGTSAAAPLWAGVATDINKYLANQSKPTLGSASAQLYQVFNTPQALTAYHDIATGTNLFYPATASYDLATGIGTPDVWNLAQDIAGDIPAITPNNLYLVTTPGVNPPPQTVTIQNNSANPYTWTLGGLPSWLSADHTSGSIPAHSTGQFTLTFTLGNTPQSYTTTLSVKDAGTVFNPFSVPVTVVSANVSKAWYFAEGYTGAGFTEYLTVANPNATPTTVTVQYLLQGGSPITKQYSVAANSRFTLNINTEIGANQNVSLVVSGSQPIIAERPMYFNFASGTWHINLPGGSDVLGATSLGTDFAFGYLDTTTNHDTYLTILNQDPSTAMQVSVSYFPASGGSPTVIPHTVPANSRGTIHVNDEHLPLGTYSALVQLSLPGLVERPMYLKDGVTGNTGAADVVGVTQPLTDWYFAEGFIDPTFSERYILSNPSTSATATGTITFFLASGAPQTANFTLAPGQQTIINAGSVPNVTGNNSAHVQADHPILAERFISFRYTPSLPGATDVLGAAAPSNLFYFAEGFTGPGFSEYLTIENPDPTQTATVQVTFLPEKGGAPIVKVFTIAPSSRFTLNTVLVVNSSFADQSFSMVVESNVPIVAERPMYFNFAPGKTGGSDIIGYQSPSTTPPPPPPPPTTLYEGSQDGYMYALNPTTGAFSWKYQTPGGLASRATFANGILYFGSDNGFFYALHASDSTLFWRVWIGSTSFPASAVVNGVVYLASERGTIYALSAFNGSVLWRYSIGRTFFTEPTVANGVVYFSVESQGVTALDASNGSVLWSYAEPNVFSSTPAVANGMVYFITGGSNPGGSLIRALNASSGAPIWSNGPLGTYGGVINSPIAANGVVYVADSLTGVYAFNGTTGFVLWHTGLPPSGDYIASYAPAVANGIVYVGNFDGNLYAYSASDGSLLWRYQTGFRVQSIPTVANGIVYFGSDDDYIYALNASTGALVWRYQTGGEVTGTSTVAP